MDQHNQGNDNQSVGVGLLKLFAVCVALVIGVWLVMKAVELLF